MDQQQQVSALLAQLRPELAPESSLWWPLAWGWWSLLAALILASLALALWQQRRQRRRLSHAFIDEALVQLRMLDSGQLDARQRLLAINAILKRAAMTAYPQDNCANISLGAWLKFLESKWPKANFQQYEQLLKQRYNGKQQPDSSTLSAYQQQAKDWLLRL